MKNEYSHLNLETRKIILESDAVRIAAIQSGAWFDYPRAKQILDELERLLHHPPITRMPNLLIVGPSNNGKSSILDHFQHKHMPDMNPEGNATIVPVVMVEAPSRPDVNDFYGRILDKLFVPYRPSSKSADRCHQVKLMFQTLQVKILIIDEIQHLIAGSLGKQRDFRNAIKSLGNETKVCIVAAGVEEAYSAFNTDPQLSNRFMPAPLLRWGKGREQELLSVLKSIERRTPLKRPSVIYENILAKKILVLSEGTLGDICDLIKLAAEYAIKCGEERITLDLLDKLSWVPPSKRKASAAWF